MKKILALALLLLLVGSGVFAMDKAVGGGALFNMAWSVGEWDYNLGGYNCTDKLTFSRQGFGGFAFFGIGRFFELNLGFMYKQPKKATLWDDWLEEEEEIDLSVLDATTALQFGLYFKYPFVLSDRFVLFPTLGIDYELTMQDTYKLWWDDLWFRGGAGMDIFFTDRVFLRAHFIYGIAVLIGTKDSFFDPSFEPDRNYTHGLLIKVGVGFMF